MSRKLSQSYAYNVPEAHASCKVCAWYQEIRFKLVVYWAQNTLPVHTIFDFFSVLAWALVSWKWGCDTDAAAYLGQQPNVEL